jgi:hypothetical protein
MSDKRYISCADTAKLIRPILKREFPGVTFGVTSKTYSMGASIDIQWTDGPTTEQVDRAVGAFKGKGFDGMVDCGYYYDAWLLPDGTATIAKRKSSGTTIAPYENDKPHPDAELVSFGSDYIHTDRHHSPEHVRRVAAELAAKTGWPAPAIKEQDSYWSRSRRIRTAYFERGHTTEEDERERDFTDAVYRTPGGGPLVTRFDYAFEDDPEPEPETRILAPERTEEEQIAVYRETLAEIPNLPDLPPRNLEHEVIKTLTRHFASRDDLTKLCLAPWFAEQATQEEKERAVLPTAIAHWADWEPGTILPIVYALLEEINYHTPLVALKAFIEARAD